MRNKFTQDLPPIGGFIPLPIVIETEGDSAWAAWDDSVRELDNPADIAAQRLSGEQK